MAENVLHPTIEDAAKQNLPSDENSIDSSGDEVTDKLQDITNKQTETDNDNKVKKRGRPRKKSENLQTKIDALTMHHENELKRLRKKFEEKEQECEMLNMDIMVLRKQCSDKTTENDNLRETNQELMEEVASSSNELKVLKEMLEERENDFSELLEQLVLQEHTPEKKTKKPKGLLVADELFIGLFQNLGSEDIEWDFRAVLAKKLNENVMTMLSMTLFYSWQAQVI
jgi:chromosome segregation ATPase